MNSSNNTRISPTNASFRFPTPPLQDQSFNHGGPHSYDANTNNKLLLSSQRLLGGLRSTRDSVGHRLHDALGGVGCLVGSTADRVAHLLGGTLLATIFGSC